MNRILAWDPQSGVITCEPGVTIAQLWRATLADGWWPPVVPGTMAVTLGGAAAANIHGKNNWRDGSFGEHILRFELLLPSGEVVSCSPDERADLFHAAIGGYGLLGCFTAITLQMRRIYSGLVDVRQTAHPTLEALLAALDAGSERATHAVAWVDTGARGKARGRGLLKTMRELGPGEDPNPRQSLDPAFQPPSGRLLGVAAGRVGPDASEANGDAAGHRAGELGTVAARQPALGESATSGALRPGELPAQLLSRFQAHLSSWRLDPAAELRSA